MSPLPAGFGRNLKARVLTALVALPTLLAALLLGPPLLGVAVVGLAVLLGLREFYGLLAARQLVPLHKTGLLVATLIFLEEAHVSQVGPPLWPLVALLLLTATLRAGDLEHTVPSAAATFLGATYLGALGGSMAGLRLIEPVHEGAARLLLLLVIIWCADTFAFFTGYTLGRHRLAPRISPGKTVEGALGGLAGGVAGALAVRAWALPRLPLVDAALLGLAVAALGIVGDLLESLLKRWAGIKDSGTLFPGHGGMLDRLDSLLFGAPVLYVYFSLGR